MGRLVNNEVERMCKEAVVRSFKGVVAESSGATEDIRKNSQSGYLVFETRFETQTSRARSWTAATTLHAAG
jgi:hypothetical protein